MMFLMEWNRIRFPINLNKEICKLVLFDKIATSEIKYLYRFLINNSLSGYHPAEQIRHVNPITTK